jgi:homospermidine synthase
MEVTIKIDLDFDFKTLAYQDSDYEPLKPDHFVSPKWKMHCPDIFIDDYVDHVDSDGKHWFKCSADDVNSQKRSLYLQERSMQEDNKRYGSRVAQLECAANIVTDPYIKQKILDLIKYEI